MGFHKHSRTELISFSEMCELRSQQNILRRRRCGRSVVESLTLLFLKKAMISCFFTPVRMVFKWVLWKYKWQGYKPRRRMIVDNVALSQMAITWGIFIPLLMPITVLEMYFNGVGF